MKEKLIRVYQLLNVLSISGHQNILALGESINLIQNIINDMDLDEGKSQSEEPIKIDNTKDTNNPNPIKKEDKT
jgi:hypothetical protein